MPARTFANVGLPAAVDQRVQRDALVTEHQPQICFILRRNHICDRLKLDPHRQAVNRVFTNCHEISEWKSNAWHTHRQNLDKAGYVIVAVIQALHSLHMLATLQQLAKVGFPQPTQMCLFPLVHQDVLQHKGPILITNALPCIEIRGLISQY